ncbi:hypothetical protein LEP1GSC198_3054 [Leptospira kirschneri str. JB]|nr:hypothetical protein LEP1GSC198_3054 [Leptospira kirschneri str. JB]
MCQKEESSKTISEKKETSNPNPWFLSKIVIWCQTMDVGFSVRDPTCVVRLISND